jgi:glycosyltransferase involved in cell wall biosynthesis
LGRSVNSIVLKTQIKIVYDLLKIQQPIVWINTPTGWPVVSNIPNRALIYQRTDDYAAYDFDNFNSAFVKEIDDLLLSKADLVLHVSDELHHQSLGKTSRAVLLPQGVDEIFFGGNHQTPQDMINIPKPILGYVGLMDRHKFDTGLVFDVVKAFPHISFVLVGLPNANIEPLLDFPNVFYLGRKDHAQIPAYVNNFDLCMLPTARTAWGMQCRPLKLLEYLAAGKPVIATPTPASEKYHDIITIEPDAAAWISAIETFRLNKLDIHNRFSSKPAPNLTTWDMLADKLWGSMLSSKFEEGYA